ncbi:alpha/beta hydrolase [Kitasatospora sp. NPDC092948]|uniref:alpha/beta hydrolase n=1 Tax=Kitasatospora sp. NPDC092948 TaxID=3364088 RepID=UPI003821A568
MRSNRRRGTAVAALVLAAVLGVGSWTPADAQTPLTGPPQGSAQWVADTALGVRLPDPATASPAEVTAFFGGLTPDQQRQLAFRHPQVLGNLDGAPIPLRYLANSLAVTQERVRELSRAADLALPSEEREQAARLAARYAGLSGRRLLAFDPRGRGQLAEVFGDLTHDARTAVLVPGSDTDLSTFDRLADTAKALRTATDDRVAVVAWVGYTTPVGVGIDAAREELARAGAPRLARLVAGLAPVTGPVTLFCHSYGSVVCGQSAPDPAQVAGLVVFASPGLGLARADEVRVPVWAVARNPEDWISNVPNVSVLGFGHGADPTSPAFGAHLLPSTGSHGHSDYFAPGSASLAAFAALAATGSPTTTA